MFSLSRDAATAALEEVKQKEEEHYDVECPRCRHVVKIPRNDLERMQPREG
jgi:hypothetical protein